MLPPGIFAWTSGLGESVSPVAVEALARAHPSWAADMLAFGPWDDRVQVPGFGRFVAAGTPSEATIVVAGECSTTMEAARNLAEGGVLGPWSAVIAPRQTRGRGQLRRPWVSSPGNLHMSLVMPAPPESGPWREALADLLPLVAGYLFAEALSALGGDIWIKWPNDLIQFNRKVGGILIEERKDLVVLGLGLNLVDSPPDELMREDSSVSAGVLGIPCHKGGPLALCEQLVNRGRKLYSILFNELEPSQFPPVVAKRLAWRGRRIQVREGADDIYQAEIMGISPNGGLVLRREGRETVLYSGSIFPL
jgi:BirA family biotin operon repressor/biotin-[acetyl-CoA-carboxylase] ligase